MGSEHKTVSIKSSRKLITTTIAVTIAVLMIFPSFLSTRVHADNVNALEVVAGSASMTAGSSTTITYKIVATGGDGLQGCNADTATPAIVTITHPSAVTVNPPSLTFPNCQTTLPVTFQASQAGSYSISATVSDSGPGSYNVQPATYTLIVNPPADTTPPVVSVPDHITAEATGPSGAVVYYTNDGTASGTSLVSANDDQDGSLTPTCTPASGSTFPIGTTPVTCTATDSHGNTASKAFTVIVQDTTKPLVSVPEDITKEATGPSGAIVQYTATASDSVDGSLTPTCTPASGSTFPIGTTPVTCTAADSHGNTGTNSFNILVRDTTPPDLTLPDPITAEATGPNGATLTYTATASDLVDGQVLATCNPASGSTFPITITTVTCTATDSHGNTASKTFTVTVQDTTAPDISGVPTDMSVHITSDQGAVVSFATPTASDLVDGQVAVTCTPPSGSIFPISTTPTTVTCSATDLHGNKATGSFMVTVIAPKVSIFLQPINDPGPQSNFKQGSTIAVKFTMKFADDGSSYGGCTNCLISVTKASSADATPVNEAVATGQTDSGTSFRYDPTGLQYIFNESTKNLQKNTDYRITASFDGIADSHSVVVGVR